jgi:DNA repair protein RecO (recombination protein O)
MKIQPLFTVEGIVLKRKVVGEADRILTLFTKQRGKIRVLAKGIRKIHSRRSGHVELFSHVVLTVHAHKSLDIMTEAQAITAGSYFADHPERMGYAYCLCELVDQLLPDNQEHTDVFFLLSQALSKLSRQSQSEELQETMSTFLHELLWGLGFLPVTRKLPDDGMRSYVEQITERKLRTWPLLTSLGVTS